MRIGLTYTGSPEKHGNYVNWLKGDDGEAVEVVRLSVNDDNLEALRQCDALVLSGGVDIDPTLYGGPSGYDKAPKEGWQKERDLFERAALKLAWERGLPVLGVCRGLQLINVTLKGTLVQDLGRQGDETHENVAGIDKRHLVRIGAGTLLHAVVGGGEGEVNSAHHQAIQQLGEGLVMNCLAEDGTIEGIEWADPAGKPFLLGVQWHPERMFTNRLPALSFYGRIRDRYLEEIKKSSTAK